MQGTLSTYHAAKRLTVFESAPVFDSVVLFIAGLGDALNAVPYLNALAAALEPAGWSLAQLLLSSSGSAWGMKSVQDDAEELRECLRFLKRHKTRIVVLGHSTGCQDCVELFRSYSDAPELVDGCILQAPVSDREASLMHMEKEEMKRLLARANELIEAGKGAQPMLESAEVYAGEAVSALRFRSLNAYEGDEDFFSSDLSSHRLKDVFRGLSRRPVLIVIGEKDEHMPQDIDKNALLERLGEACPSTSAESLVLPGATHSIDDAKARDEFMNSVLAFLRSL